MRQSNCSVDSGPAAGPDALARSRESVAQAKQLLRRKWHNERAATFQARVEEEHERLVHVFVGPDGLKPSAWPRLPHQLALVAERNVKRQDKLEKERYELEIWSMPDVLSVAIQFLRASETQEDEQGHVSPKRRTTSSSWGWRQGQMSLQHTDTMTSKQRRTAMDVVNSIIGGKMRLKNRRSSTGVSLDEMDYERVRNVAAGFKSKVKKSAEAKAVPDPQRESRGSGRSPRSFKFGAPRRKSSEDKSSSGAEAQASSPKDAQDKSNRGGRPKTPELFKGQRPSFGSRGMPSFDGGSSRGSHAGSSMRRMQGSKQRRVEDMGPLAMAYHQATKKAGASFNQAIAEALCDSDPSCELRITGVVLNAVASAALAEVLTTCHHLTTIQFTRTVLNHAALEILLPAARTLKLKSLLFLSSNFTPECCPLLVTAFSRPTESLAMPPSEWWLSLQSVDLGGNPLGDQGFAALLPVLPQLQSLKSLILRQTGLTDWSSPQVESLLRTMSGLHSLDLAQNQLGPLVGKALAASLAACSQLEALDLSWNPLGSSVQHIGWALIAPRFKGCYRLKSISLAGCDLEAEDHMALAAFLRFGMPGVPLEKLDLSHAALVGVSAQCLLRQLNRLLPPMLQQLEPEPAEAAPPPPPRSMLQKSIAAFGKKTADQPKPAWPPEPTPGSNAGHGPARPQTAPRRHRKLTEQQQLEEELREEVERESRPPSLTQATLMGCRVELDGGSAPKARMKATTFPPNLRHGTDASGQRAHARIASKSGAGPLDTLARKRLSFGRSGDELPPLQHYRLDLGVDRPDRVILQMLVEQELDARHHRLLCWYDMALDGRVIRRNGRDIVPFDVLYEGWRCESSIPRSGVLELGVACLPEGASPWWLNNRLQFNAVHLLNKRGKLAAKNRAEPGAQV